MLVTAVATGVAAGAAGAMRAPESDGSTYVWSGASRISVGVEPWGSGWVRSDPYLIDCPLACERSIDKGRSVTFTANPTGGFTFAGWDGACAGQGATCTLTVSTAEIELTAYFSGAFAAPVTTPSSGGGTSAGTPTGPPKPTGATKPTGPTTPGTPPCGQGAATGSTALPALTGPRDLGTLGGSESVAVDINDAGWVVGESGTAGEAVFHAFLWTSKRGMVDLGTLGGALSSANAVSNAGQVVGWSGTARGASHAFSWTPDGGMVDLGTLGAGSTATAVSDTGQVVGSSTTAEGASHAFSWTAAGGMKDLGTFAGDDESRAVAVNESGLVVGTSSSSRRIETSGSTPGHISSTPRAFAWTEDGGIVALGTLGGSRSEAQSVNALGQVAGWSTASAEEDQAFDVSPVGWTRHAFCWSPNGGMVDLGVKKLEWGLEFPVFSSRQVVLNDVGAVAGSGQIVSPKTPPAAPTAPATVGPLGQPPPPDHAFLWTEPTGPVDLGTLGGNASYANDLDDGGTVVGFSWVGDVYHPFAWTAATGMVDLGTLGGCCVNAVAVAINAAHQIVGWSTKPVGPEDSMSRRAPFRAVLWEPAG